MAELNLTELRKVAEAATPGPWREEYSGKTGPVVIDDESINMLDHVAKCPRTHDTFHIAAFDPPTVLALLDRVAELEDRLRATEAELGTRLNIERSRLAVIRAESQ